MSRKPENQDVEDSSARVDEALQLVIAELVQLVPQLNASQIGQAISLLSDSKRIFTFGAGRSGLALRMAAMRLMHLGLEVHVAGEATTPAIAAGDLLIVASASGSSASAVHAGQVARKQGATLLVITAKPDSELATMADTQIAVPAATKDQFEVPSPGGSGDKSRQRASQQYAGSLFEQAVVLLFDAIFHAMWKTGGVAAEDLMKRHANLE